MTAAKNKVLAFLEKISKGFILILSGILLFALTITGLIERAYIAQNSQETCVFIPQNNLFSLAILLAVFMLFLTHKVLLKIKSRTLFLCLSCLYLVAGMYLVMNAPPDIRADASIVYSFANAFNQGDYSSLATGGYLARYPHQLGLVTFERILMLVSSNMLFLFTLNLIMVLIINYMQWKISEILSMNHTAVVNYTLILSFAFLPQYFFILFLYGLIPGLCCMISAVYFMMRYFQKRTLKSCVFSIFLAAIACTLRNNYFIGVIAMVILYLLDFLRSRKTASILIALAIIGCTLAFPKSIAIWYQSKSGIAVGSGTPKLLWVTMGLQDGGSKMNGWYNDYVWVIPKESNFDHELMIERARTDLRERLGYFKENPHEAFQFFMDKAKSTWLDPLFQSIWSGPLEDCNQYMKTKPLSDLYTGKGAYGYITCFSNIVLMMIYLMALCYAAFTALIKRASVPCENLFSYLFLLGGFLFHLVWETKSQYVYPYVFMLIPMAALGINLTYDLSIGKLRVDSSQRGKGEELSASPL